MKNSLYAMLLLFVSAQVSASNDIEQASLTNTAEEEAVVLDGFYIGAGVGFTTGFYTVFDYDDFDDSLSTEFDSLNNGNSAFKIYSGYHINRIIGVEASYTEYGKLKASGGGLIKGEISPVSISVAANMGYTFNTGLRPFAIAGLSYLNLNASDDWFDNDSHLAFHYGFGGEYQPSTVTGLTFRLAYEADVYSTSMDELYTTQSTHYTRYFSNIGSLYLGASYKF